MAATDPLITPEDVAARLGVEPYEDDLERDQVAVQCADVSAVIRSKRRSIDAWLAAGLIDLGIVKAVACQMLSRALLTVHTGGIPIVGESHPEYSVQYNQAVKAGLRIEPEELALLTITKPRAKAFSIIPS
jgi:hypothetical protein